MENRIEENISKLPLVRENEYAVFEKDWTCFIFFHVFTAFSLDLEIFSNWPRDLIAANRNFEYWIIDWKWGISVWVHFTITKRSDWYSHFCLSSCPTTTTECFLTLTAYRNHLPPHLSETHTLMHLYLLEFSILKSLTLCTHIVVFSFMYIIIIIIINIILKQREKRKENKTCARRSYVTLEFRISRNRFFSFSSFGSLVRVL